MSVNLIAFECGKCLDGYKILATERSYLVATSERFDRYSPLDHFPALFASFAGAPASGEGMRGFADNFGLPAGDAVSESNAATENLDYILTEHAVMRRALTLFEKGDRPGLMKLLHSNQVSVGQAILGGRSGRARLELRLNAAGAIETVIVPASLIQAMWIQFMLHAASGAQLFRCEQCKKPFVVGSGTKRRSTAKYCSNACKVAAFKAKQEA